VTSTTPLRFGEQVFEVALAIEGNHIHATIDGEVIDAQRLASPSPPYATAGTVVHEIAFTRDGRTYCATVARSRDRVLVALDGHTYGFVVGEDTRTRGAAGGTGTITAPMPGKIIAVLVGIGDRVEHGQPVVVLEAMKMETTLVADVDGEVVRIAATPGETVDGGVVLVEITPA
jgi:acetyl/propionyl-CoA carboxylase alpha subunit